MEVMGKLSSIFLAIILSIIGGLDIKVGWVIDYHEITKIMAPILAQLDHKILNDVPGLENPTSEFLANSNILSWSKVLITMPSTYRDMTLA